MHTCTIPRFLVPTWLGMEFQGSRLRAMRVACDTGTLITKESIGHILPAAASSVLAKEMYEWYHGHAGAFDQRSMACITTLVTFAFVIHKCHS